MDIWRKNVPGRRKSGEKPEMLAGILGQGEKQKTGVA